MNFKSRRIWLAIFAGMVIAVLVTIFIRPSCLGIIIGVIVSIYLAKAESPKVGALIGAITVLPTGVYITFFVSTQTKAIHYLGLVKSIPFLLLDMIFLSGIGALYGLVIGLLLRKVKDKNWIP